MKTTFIQSIIENSRCGITTYHGSYAYKANVHTGEILRCRRGDEDREWIDNDGNVFGAWTLVAHA